MTISIARRVLISALGGAAVACLFIAGAIYGYFIHRDHIFPYELATRGQNRRAEYFMPAATIADFLPAELRF